MEFLHPAIWHVDLESWQWIHQVAALCNVIRGSGMTCHWIRPNVRHIGILHLVSISTSPQSTCHSVPVCEILSKSDHPRQKKWRHVDFQDGGSQPSWVFQRNHYWIPTIQYITSYRSSIDTIALNCLVFEKIAFFCILATDRQMGSTDALTCSRCRERRLNKYAAHLQLDTSCSHYHDDMIWHDIQIFNVKPKTDKYR